MQKEILDISPLSAHYGRKLDLIGTKVTVKSAYLHDYFTERGYKGYASVYFTSEDGTNNCIFGCLLGETNHSWEV